MEFRDSWGKTPRRYTANMAHVCVKSMNWANCQQMMNSVVVEDTDTRLLQPGLEVLVVTEMARICARHSGKAKLSLSGGVHMTLVASPWL